MWQPDSSRRELSAEADVIVWDRLLRCFLPSPEPPPAVPPVRPLPRVETTPIEERREVDQKLTANAARLAELKALAGLDWARSRGHHDGR